MTRKSYTPIVVLSTIPTTTHITKPTTTPNTITGNWWGELSKPQYSGEIAIRLYSNIANFDLIPQKPLWT